MSEEKASPGIPSGTWPVPPGLPLYVSVEPRPIPSRRCGSGGRRRS